MLEYVLEHNHLIAIADIEQPDISSELNEREPILRPILGAGVVVAAQKHPDGRHNILVQGVTRLSLIEEHPQIHAFRQVNGEILHDLKTDGDRLVERALEVRQLLKEMSAINPKLEEAITAISENAGSPDVLSNMLGAHLVNDPGTKRIIFEELNPYTRLEMLYESLGTSILNMMDEEGKVMH